MGSKDEVYEMVRREPGRLQSEYRDIAMKRGISRSTFYECVNTLEKEGKIVKQRGRRGVRLFPRGGEEIADPDYVDELIRVAANRSYAIERRRDALHTLRQLSRTRVVLFNRDLVDFAREFLNFDLEPTDPTLQLSHVVAGVLANAVEKLAASPKDADQMDRSTEIARLKDGLHYKLVETFRRHPEQGAWILPILEKFAGTEVERSGLIDLALEVALGAQCGVRTFEPLKPVLLRTIRGAIGENRNEARRVHVNLQECLDGSRSEKDVKAQKLIKELREFFVALSA